MSRFRSIGVRLLPAARPAGRDTELEPKQKLLELGAAWALRVVLDFALKQELEVLLCVRLGLGLVLPVAGGTVRVPRFAEREALKRMELVLALRKASFLSSTQCGTLVRAALHFPAHLAKFSQPRVTWAEVELSTRALRQLCQLCCWPGAGPNDRPRT